jgi:hypothetical protein
VSTSSDKDVETRANVDEGYGRKPLCEDIGKLCTCRNMENTNFAECHLLTDKVNIYLNVFSMSMLNWIGGHVDGQNIIRVDNCGTLNRSMELDE